MKSAAQYIAEAKAKLGDPRMSDRELGEHLGGLSQPYIAGAKSGKLTDPLALKLAAVLGVAAGELLMVARLEREKDPEVKAALTAWAKNVFAAMAPSAAHERGAVAGGSWRRR